MLWWARATSCAPEMIRPAYGVPRPSLTNPIVCVVLRASARAW